MGHSQDVEEADSPGKGAGESFFYMPMGQLIDIVRFQPRPFF